MDNLTSVVSGNLGKALEEVDKLLRNPRTRVEIITLGRQMKTVIGELGAKTLELYKQGRIEDAELAELCARIVSIEARIAEREARLAADAARSEGSSGRTTTSAAKEQFSACPRCKTELPADAVFCYKCGLELGDAPADASPEPNYCATCGRELRPGAKFCPRCGSAA